MRTDFSSGVEPSGNVQGTVSLNFLSLDFKGSDIEGYLGEGMPNPMLILPPPPDKGSSEWELDMHLSRVYLNAERPRKKLAKRDAILRFPEATEAFNPVLNLKIHREKTPSLYRILAKSCVDGGRSTKSAKQFYKRPRPFMVNQLPTLTPQDEEILKLDGSYPSGHSAIGWIWALILKDLFPSQTTEILKRGRQFGISRSICNVHWHSDVVAGRICGAAVTKSLYVSPDFLFDLSTAKKEIEFLNKKISPEE
jgi:acid phosphatase (class A)